MALFLAHLVYGVIVFWLASRDRGLKFIKAIKSLPSPSPSFDRLALPPAPPLIAPEIPPDFCVNSNDPMSIFQQSFPPLAHTIKEVEVPKLVRIQERIEIFNTIEVPVSNAFESWTLISLLILVLMFLVYYGLSGRMKARRPKEPVSCEACVYAATFWTRYETMKKKLQELEEPGRHGKKLQQEAASRHNTIEEKPDQDLIEKRTHYETQAKSLGDNCDDVMKEEETQSQPVSEPQSANNSSKLSKAELEKERIKIFNTILRKQKAATISEKRLIHRYEKKIVSKEARLELQRKRNAEIREAYNAVKNELEEANKALEQLKIATAGMTKRPDTNHQTTNIGTSSTDETTNSISALKVSDEKPIDNIGEQTRCNKRTSETDPPTGLDAIDGDPYRYLFSDDEDDINDDAGNDLKLGGDGTLDTGVEVSASTKTDTNSEISTRDIKDSRSETRAFDANSDINVNNAVATAPTTDSFIPSQSYNTGKKTVTSNRDLNPEAHLFKPTANDQKENERSSDSTVSPAITQSQSSPKENRLPSEIFHGNDALGVPMPRLVRTIADLPYGYQIGRSEVGRIFQYNRGLLYRYSIARGQAEEKSGTTDKTKMFWSDRTDQKTGLAFRTIVVQEELKGPPVSTKTMSYEQYVEKIRGISATVAQSSFPLPESGVQQTSISTSLDKTRSYDAGAKILAEPSSWTSKTPSTTCYDPPRPPVVRNPRFFHQSSAIRRSSKRNTRIPASQPSLSGSKTLVDGDTRGQSTVQGDHVFNSTTVPAQDSHTRPFMNTAFDFSRAMPASSNVSTTPVPSRRFNPPPTGPRVFDQAPRETSSARHP